MISLTLFDINEHLLIKNLYKNSIPENTISVNYYGEKMTV